MINVENFPYCLMIVTIIFKLGMRENVCMSNEANPPTAKLFYAPGYL